MGNAGQELSNFQSPQQWSCLSLAKSFLSMETVEWRQRFGLWVSGKSGRKRALLFAQEYWRHGEGMQRAACALPGTSRLSACALGSACRGIAHLVLPLAVTVPLLLFCPKVRQDQAVAEGDHECAVRVVHEPHCREFHHQPSSAGKALRNGRHVTGFIFVWII